MARPLQTAHRRDPPADAAEPPVKQPSLEVDGLGSDLAPPHSWADWPRDHGEPCRGPVAVLSPRKAEVVVARCSMVRGGRLRTDPDVPGSPVSGATPASPPAPAAGQSHRTHTRNPRATASQLPGPAPARWETDAVSKILQKRKEEKERKQKENKEGKERESNERDRERERMKQKERERKREEKERGEEKKEENRRERNRKNEMKGRERRKRKRERERLK